VTGFTEKNINSVVYYSCDAFEREGVKTAFTTRLGGVSNGVFSSLNLGFNRGDERENVLENYRRLAAAVGFDLAKASACRQVHETDIRKIGQDDGGLNITEKSPSSFDGAVTDLPGRALIAFTADCLPALLLDVRHRAVAAVHAGWRGTAAGILPAAIRSMSQLYESRPQDIIAALGPCISLCCFETGDDVPAAMRNAMGSEAEEFIRPAGEKWHVDIKGINGKWLEKAGVKSENIFVHPDCTVCKSDIYWSHRVTAGNRGSQGAVIVL